MFTQYTQVWCTFDRSRTFLGLMKHFVRCSQRHLHALDHVLSRIFLGAAVVRYPDVDKIL